MTGVAKIGPVSLKSDVGKFSLKFIRTSSHERETRRSISRLISKKIETIQDHVSVWA